MDSQTIIVRLEPAVEDSPPTRAAGGPARDPAREAPLLLSFRPGQTLAQTLYLSPLFQPPVLCSGLGRCGRCRVRIFEGLPAPAAKDMEVLNKEELAQGWRLGCAHPPAPGMLLALPADARLSSAPEPTEDDGPVPSGEATGFLGVDLGTTSIAWQHLGADGEILDQGSMINPQMGAGSEVISRLHYARNKGGAEILQKRAASALREIAGKTLFTRAGGPRPVVAPSPRDDANTRLCVAANPAMTALLLGKDISGLAVAPYNLPLSGGRDEYVPGFGPAWIPPQLSPFVGGDLSAGYAWLTRGPDQPGFPFLLADMGTNGEFILALSPEKALCASVALGPALEGIGLSYGTEARPGAITSFQATPKGLEPVFFQGTPPPPSGAPTPGITGTGYLSLLALLLRQKKLGQDGQPPAGQDAWASLINLPFAMRLIPEDVEEVLKVKAAFSLGAKSLLEAGEVAARDLKTIFLAGALGQNISAETLEALGFIPPGLARKIVFAGNTSLNGAALLAQSHPARQRLLAWAGGVRALDLAENSGFLAGFVDEMRFNW